MGRQAIELSVHEFLDSDRREDAFIDLKASLPIDYRKCARQIGALCNAARGEDAYWLIGVRNDRTVAGISEYDLQDWWPRVRRWFDDVVPDLTDVAIARPEGTVLALRFTTDRAPYVIKCDGQGVDREVPWRDGTTTRSAHRNEILRMLTPVRRLPNVDLIDAMMNAKNRKGLLKATRTLAGNVQVHKCHIDGIVQLFVDAAHPLSLPTHRQTAKCIFAGWRDPIDLNVELFADPSAAPSVRYSAGALQVTDPGVIDLKVTQDLWLSDSEWLELIDVSQVDLLIDLAVVGSERKVGVAANLRFLDRNLEQDHPYVRWNSTLRT